MSHELARWMQLAIDEARNCLPEDTAPHPLVGTVALRDGEFLASAYRGELNPGEHAEYTLLERKLADVPLAGSTIITTLEPCTERSHPKVPCAERLVERKVSRVFIGMLDPNPAIRGAGLRRLREANIITELFPEDLVPVVEEMNREFARAQRRRQAGTVAEEEFIDRNQARSLYEWYRAINGIYWERNRSRDALPILAHLIEVVGGLSGAASGKIKPAVEPQTYVCKALAWWMALAGKLGVRSAEQVVWSKYPARCPYCLYERHDPDECKEKKASRPGPDWEALAELGSKMAKPQRLGEWQVMFSTTYPVQDTEQISAIFARLAEELGELSEAVRVFPKVPGYFLSEAADVFAWLMHFQNTLDRDRGVLKANRGRNLEVAFCVAYPDSCIDCGDRRCSCERVLESTIGRIAHEVPPHRARIGNGGPFLAPDVAETLFGTWK